MILAAIAAIEDPKVGQGTLADAQPASAEQVRGWVQQVGLLKGRIEIEVAGKGLAELLQMPIASCAPASLTLTSKVRLTRTGQAMRLVQNDGAAIGETSPDPTLLRLVTKARGWWSGVRTAEIDVPTLASREGLTPSYFTRMLRLALLAPSVVEATDFQGNLFEGRALAGSQRAALNRRFLTKPDAIPLGWPEQQARFLFWSSGSTYNRRNSQARFQRGFSAPEKKHSSALKYAPERVRTRRQSSPGSSQQSLPERAVNPD